MNQIYRVTINQKAVKQLTKIPSYIRDKLYTWVDLVTHEGMPEVRKISGFHDEPLHGNRAGQRSIRLNKSYRAIYTELDSGEIIFIEIIEVHNHEY